MTTRLKKTKRYARRDRVRSLLDAVSDWFARATDSGAVASRSLDLLSLEDRVLFNAAPMGDVSPDAIDAVNEQIDNVVHMIDMAVHAHALDSDAASWIDEALTPADADAAHERDVSGDDADTDDDQSSLDLPASDPLPAIASYEIVFVDEGVTDYEAFVRDIQQRSGSNTRFEVITISSGESGIARITAALSEREGVDAIHFVSHGGEGSVQLGSDWLTADNFNQYAWQIDEWRFSLSQDADMLFYGCDLAGSEAGRELLTSLAASCDCDVAASDDATGSQTLGGDWELEFRFGHVQTDIAFSQTLQSDWEGVLATFTVTKTQDNVTAGTLRTAINDANASPGPDTIVFAIGSGPQKIQLNAGDLPTITGQVTINAWTQLGFAGVPLIEIDGKGSAATFQFVGGSDGSILRGFVINGSSGSGVTLNGTSNVTIEGNWIGTDNTGTAAVANAQHGIRIQNAGSNTIGGLGPNSANVISGSTQHGISTTGGASSNNVIRGNLIGTDYTGTLDLGNTLNGINLQSAGNNNTITGNVIAGNNQHGVEIQGATSGNIVRGNFIGTDTSGTVNVGNSGSGIYIPTSATSNTTIGGVSAGQGNVIKFNGSDGVTILNGSGHTIRGNSIFANGTLANDLGIDLGADGFNTNDIGDVDLGANGLQNYPIVTKAVIADNGIAISGTFDGALGATLTLDFYASNAADTSGYGEGATYLGSTAVTTDAITGYASFRQYFAGTFISGKQITATATDAAGNTSEFSLARTSVNATNSLWFSTTSDTLLASGAPGLDRWTDGTAIEFGDANFALEPGVTNGTLSKVFNLDNFAADGSAELIGLHYVSRNLTIGTGTTIDLFAGDVLFTPGSAETFGGTSVDANDVAIFRPTTVGDYSAGTFILLLNNFAGDEVEGFSLVEKDTLVGDFTVQKGTFIHGLKGNSSFKGDIYYFEPTNVGLATTGADSLLIDGLQTGIDTNITGLDLIETDIALGDEVVPAGSILITLKGDDAVGSNLLSTKRQDVFYFTVTATNKTPGPAAATATLLLQGLDINLDNGNEELAALTVVSGGDPIGKAIWAESASTTPATADWFGNSFGPETATDSVGQWYTIQAADSPTRNEIIAVGVDASNNITAQLWNGTSWNAVVAPLGNPLATVDTDLWGFDVAYESGSGDALLVWNNNTTGTNSISYSAWDGVNWSTEAFVTAPLAGKAYQMQLVADPTSDEMVLVVTNDLKQDFAIVWNGSSWGNAQVLDAAAGDNWGDIAVAYESISGDALVTFAKSDIDVFYRTFNGAWSTEGSVSRPGGPTPGNVLWTTLDADPGSDRIAMGVLTSTGKTWLNMWNGTGFGTSLKVTDTASVANAPNVAVAFEETSGTAIATYGVGTNVRYRTWDVGPGWSAELTVANVGDTTNSMMLYARPETDQLMLAVQDGGSDLNYVYWNGSSWGAPIERETNTGQTDSQPFVFVWDAGANSAPVLDTSATPVLNSVAEDAGAPVLAVGTLVSKLVDLNPPAGGLNNVTDADSVKTGIAITAADTANGTWHYSINNGAAWNPLGAVTAANSRLLAADANTRIYFQPNANYNGTVTSAITFRAWDQVSGTNGGTFDTSDNGGVTAFSSFTDTADITVTNVNDAPTIINLNGDTLAYASGSGPLVIEQGSDAAVADIDSTDFNTGNLTVSIVAGNDPAEDVLSIRDQGAGVGKISTVGASVFYDFGGGPVAIGTFAGGSGGMNLVVTLNAAASTTATTALLNNITYENTDTVSPTVGARSVRFTVNDGDGDTSLNHDATVNVGSNAAPTISNLAGDTLNYTEDDAATVIEQGVDVMVVDGDSPNFDTGNLTVSVFAGGNATEDVLSIRDQGPGAGNISVVGANVFYDFGGGPLLIGSFVGGSGGANLVVTFNATASATAAGALIENITYLNTDTAAPAITPRTIRFTLDDGDGAVSATHDATVNVAAQNDASSLSGIEGAPLPYNENAAPVAITGSLAIADVDDTNLESATIQITGNYASGQDVLAFVDTANIMGSWDTGTGTLTLTGTDSLAAYEAAVRSVTYQNTSENPSTSTRTISFTTNDGDDPSNTVTRNVNIMAINDAPTITNLNGDGLAYASGSGALVIEQGGDAVVSDVDSANFNTGNLTVRIVAGNDPTEDVLSIRHQGSGAGQIGYVLGIVSYGGTNIGTAIGGVAGTDLVVTLNANANPAAVTALVRNITYNNLDAILPTLGARTVRFTVDDGDGDVSLNHDAMINVTASTAPVITNLSGDTLAYNEGDGSRVVEQGTDVMVSDGDSTDFDTGDLTVSIASGGDATEDVLSVRNQGMGAGQIGFDGTNVYFGGMLIGTAAGGSGGANLVVTFNASADATAADALIENITYENTDTDNPQTTSRTVRFTLNDGDGATSSTHDATVNVNAVNDEQMVTTNLPLALNEGATAIIDNSRLQTADVDNTAVQVVYTVTTAPSNGTLLLSGSPTASFTQDDLNNNRVSYQHNGGETTSDSFDFDVDDGQGTVSSATFNVNITPVNDEQVITTNFPLAVNEGATATIGNTRLQTADVDNTPLQLVYTVTAAPSNGTLLLLAAPAASFTQDDLDNNRISYQHNGSETTSDSFNFDVDDGQGTVSSATFNINVAAVNDEQVFATNLPLAVNEGATAIIDNTRLQTTDVDNAPAQLVYIVTAAPSNGTLLLLGAPTASFTQDDLDNNRVAYQHDGGETISDSFDFDVDDGQGTVSSATFNVNIATVNDEQVITTNLPLAVNEGATATIGNTRLQTTDVDNTPLQLVYTVTAAPSNGTLLLLGAPTASFTQDDLDNNRISYQHNGSETTSDSFDFDVDDGQGTVSSATFNVNIMAVNDEQTLTTNLPLAVNEGATATIDGTRLRTTDVDNTPLQLVYTVTTAPSNGTLLLSGLPTASFTQDDLGNNRLSYEHNGGETTSDSFDFVVDDGQGTVSSATFFLNINAINDAPALAGIEGAALTYTEGDVPVSITGSLAIADVDDSVIESATIQITGNYNIGQDKLAFANTATISGDWNASTGTLTLTNPDSLANYEAALRSVTYANTSTTPSTATRTVRFVVHDGDAPSNAATRNIAVTSVNSVPVTASDSYNVFAGKTLAIGLPSQGVLANDLDPEGEPLTAIVSTGPTKGMVVLQANGTFTYTPNPGAFGADEFYYVANDGTASSVPTRVVITIAVAGPPGGGGIDSNPPGRPDRGDENSDDSDREDSPPIRGVQPPAIVAPPGSASSDNGTGQQLGLVPPPIDNVVSTSSDEDVDQGVAVLELVDNASATTSLDARDRQIDRERDTAGASDNRSTPNSDITQPFSSVEFGFISPSGAMWQDLDEFEELVENDVNFEAMMTASTIGTTTTLWAAYVLWFFRGSYLVSCVLAQMPAWKMIDPMFVFAGGELLGDEDDESLNAMLQRSNEADHDAPVVEEKTPTEAPIC